MLDFYGQRYDQDDLGDLSAERLDIDLPVSVVDLSLVLSESAGRGMNGKIQYNADLFDASTVEVLGEHFLGSLGDLTANLDQRIGRARILGPAERVAPESPVESAVAEIWREVLGRDDVCADTDVFDRGAHSFMLMRVVARIRQRFGLTVPLRVFFERQTVGQLAQHIEAAVEVDSA